MKEMKRSAFKSKLFAFTGQLANRVMHQLLKSYFIGKMT